MKVNPRQTLKRTFLLFYLLLSLSVLGVNMWKSTQFSLVEPTVQSVIDQQLAPSLKTLVDLRNQQDLFTAVYLDHCHNQHEIQLGPQLPHIRQQLDTSEQVLTLSRQLFTLWSYASLVFFTVFIVLAPKRYDSNRYVQRNKK